MDIVIKDLLKKYDYSVVYHVDDIEKKIKVLENIAKKLTPEECILLKEILHDMYFSGECNENP